ncbi:MAG: glycosyl transferase [Bacteroidia bacterium]|nr:MAG: glycosyl transferase [Bacteroidia bacterium]
MKSKHPSMKLSVIMPVFNEENTLREVVERVLTVPGRKEIIIVDDGSTDGTRNIMTALEKKYRRNVVCLYHSKNRGKGKAIQTGLAEASGDVVVIQDADREYHPEEYPKALELIEQGWADAVYGSRFLGVHRVFLFWHYLGNKMLTFLTNMMTSGMLTDMETGFKVIRTDVLRSLDIRSFTFDFEVEVTVKLFRNGYRVYEIPITYTGRGYEEGKKITWRDGLRALAALIKWSLLVRQKKRSLE